MPNNRKNAINKAAEIVERLEKNLSAPTQTQIDDLYKVIYDFIKKSLQQAEMQGKPCLFLIGEAHSTHIAKSSLVIEKIFLQVANHFGITRLFKEGTKEALHLNQKYMTQIIRQKKKNDAKNYLTHANNCEVGAHLLNQDIIKKFELIPTEQHEDLNYQLQFSQINEEMANTLLHYDSSSLFIVGLEHLQELYENKALRAKYLMFPVNTLEPTLLKEIYRAMTKNKNPDIFSIQSKNVVQFHLKARLIDFIPGLLMDMVDEAHKKSMAAALLTQPNPVTDLNVEKSTLQPTEQSLASSKISTQVLGINHAKIAARQETYNHPEDTSTLSYQIEAVPFNSIFTIGFWAAAKMGFCANPIIRPLPLIFEDLFAEKVYKDQAKQAAAEYALAQKGTSMEAALNYLFGNNYRQGSEKNKGLLENFLVNIINRDCSEEVGIKFDQLANIENSAERHKKLNEHFVETEKKEYSAPLKYRY